jgi:hypothetical protein
MCNKSFISNYKLKTHERIRSGNQSFICFACNMSFSKRSNLKVHRIVCALGKILGKDVNTLYCSWHSATPQHDQSANRGQTFSCDS